MSTLLRLLAMLALLAAWPSAHAALSCDPPVTGAGVTINYVNNTTMTVQSTFDITCRRTSTGDATTLDVEFEMDNGLYNNGTNNRARHTITTSAFIKYDFYRASNCGSKWKGNQKLSATFTWAAGTTGPQTKTVSYWACINTAQVAAAEGLHSDTGHVTTTYGTTTLAAVDLNVSIYAPAYCNLTTPPGDISVSYTAFGAQQSGSTGFGLTCTIGMTYTIATDVTESLLTGLRYILSTSPATTAGTGALQNYSIIATFPAGQAGSCAAGSCSGTNTHTLTITY
ncbi:MAG: spore coat protein U domain-containing protein [Burkholderiales bacterium]|nr:spore coat protein U domain-containing protein [Burkholderiales bacterium]